MPNKAILLDTNVYLRLAKSIRPLLGKSFGTEQSVLYIHKDLQRELDRNPRLQNSFFWLEEEEYKKERKHILPINKKSKEEIETTYGYIAAYQKDNLLNLSRVDIYCLATALVLEILLVTDDGNMLKTAEFYGIEATGTLGLLKHMEDSGYITHDKVDQIVSYLIYVNDFPPKLKSIYQSIWKKDIPE